MSGLVGCDDALTGGGEKCASEAHRSNDDAINCVFKVRNPHACTATASSCNCSLITDVGNVSTDEAWRERSKTQRVAIAVVGNRNGREVNAKNGRAPAHVRRVNVDVTVEATGAEDCLVKYIEAVGRRENDDVTRGAKAIHLYEELIESILALGAGAACSSGATTGASQGVNFVYNRDVSNGLCEVCVI